MAGTEAGSAVPLLQPQKKGSAVPHNGVVTMTPEVILEKNEFESSVSAQIFDVNPVNLTDQLCDKLCDDIAAPNSAEMKKVDMVGLDHNFNCSYDSVGLSSIDAIEINK
jgi:hypothetical protein